MDLCSSTDGPWSCLPPRGSCESRAGIRVPVISLMTHFNLAAFAAVEFTLMKAIEHLHAATRGGRGGGRDAAASP